MSSISIQFHAMPEEIVPQVLRCAANLGVHITQVYHRPFALLPIGAGTANCEEYPDELALTIAQPVREVVTMSAFLDANPGTLLFEIGRLSPLGLAESWMSAKNPNPDEAQPWKKVVKEVKRILPGVGAWAINPKNGAKGVLKNHRFSEGALRAFAAGEKLLPAAGHTVLVPLSHDFDAKAKSQ